MLVCESSVNGVIFRKGTLQIENYDFGLEWICII